MNAIKKKAIRLAYKGTEAQVSAFEDAQGASLSSVLDDLWATASEHGDQKIADRLEKAFNHLTE